ncbi:hypothetical protein HHI36_006583 [Cryptolaemus montrouzieri]|uniref:Uncharacterized protein n=1 Tax=Cryptolaemus montrouzieri TaxID=559131 RepID=A0ABD2NXI6_9CUCU
MWQSSLLLIRWGIILLILVGEVHQNVSVTERSKMPQHISPNENSRISGRKIEAVIEDDGIIINILDHHRLRHGHRFKNWEKADHGPRWSSETERDMIKNIRCRRYNGGYYVTNRCTNYCDCPYYYSKYNCAPCPYRPSPSYVPPYAPSVIISKSF